MSDVMTRESVRGYVNTLYRSYNCCMARKVCFPEKPKIRFASRCNSVKSYNCGANCFFCFFSLLCMVTVFFFLFLFIFLFFFFFFILFFFCYVVYLWFYLFLLFFLYALNGDFFVL